MKVTFILALTAASTLRLAAQANVGPPPVSICDLLHDPYAFNGKVVAVRGEHYVGGHGLYLRGEKCSGVVTTKGYHWPPLIWIVNNKEEIERHGFNLDQYMRALREIDSARRSQSQSRGAGVNVARLLATYVGLFETHENLDGAVFQRPDGSVVGAGFGQVPGAPGQLFVQSVQDITVEFEDHPANKGQQKTGPVK